MRKSLVFLALLSLAVMPALAQRKVVNLPNHNDASPFSDAVMAGNMLYLSGNIGNDPATGKVPDDFSEEARQALKNLGAVLKHAGLDYTDVVKVNVFLTDMARFDDWNKVYIEFFKSDRPARSTVGVTALARGAKLELEMIALRSGAKIVPASKK